MMMEEKTYNLGRVVGWSQYEEFLKENPELDPQAITPQIYSTLVTYGVTRIVTLPADRELWRMHQDGSADAPVFYTTSVRVPGASWGAVPIVGIDYNSYFNSFNPNQEGKYHDIAASAAIDKDALERAVGNIFTCYISDSNGKRAEGPLSDSGYLTFAAYPDIFEYLETMSEYEEFGGLKLIVRGLSLVDVDVDELYFGPQGLLFAGNGMAEDCYHETRNINNLCLNSAGCIWLSLTGNSSPADYRGLVNHPTGQILVSTFGYINLDFLNGVGEFADMGTYGFTAAEIQQALQGIQVVWTQFDAIPLAERDEYLYLISGEPSYNSYPPAGNPLFIIPVRKLDGKINVGNYDYFSPPKMKKIMDFTRTYSAGDDGDNAVLYLYDKMLPEYMGTFWGYTVPVTFGLTYLGSNSLNNSWITDDLSIQPGVTYSNSGRQCSYRIPTGEPNLFHKGYFYILTNESELIRNGLYLCTADQEHDDTAFSRLSRRGGYIEYAIPQWVKNKKTGGNKFAFEVDLTGMSATIQDDILYVAGNSIYPGDLLMLGIESDYEFVYVWNTIDNNQPKLIVDINAVPYFDFDATASATISDESDTHSSIISIPRSDWDSVLASTSLTVWTDENSSYSFTNTNDTLTLGVLVRVRHLKSGVWGNDKTYSYLLLNLDNTAATLSSAMVLMDNPSLTTTVGYPGYRDGAVPRYNQELPNSQGNYYYNMKSVLSRTTAYKMFSDFGWDISDYVDEDFQRLSLAEFFQECVLRSDMSVPKSSSTNRSYGITSRLCLYSKEDIDYTPGQVMPEPNPEIHSSMTWKASTTPQSFFDTAYYECITSDGSVINLSNPDYPIWATVAKSRRGRQTMSVSILDAAGGQLDFTGNEGTIEADTITWLDLLTGLGTGQALDILHGLKIRHNTDSIQLITPEGLNLYLAPQAPTGDIEDGSVGLGW